MHYLHFVPHVNRPDLTLTALRSVPKLWHKTIIIDNSIDHELQNLIETEIPVKIKIIKPSVPLTTAQTYNLIRKTAIQQHTDFITFMHNDCEVITPNGDRMLVDEAVKIFGDNTSKIGWIHQDASENEDLFCAYKTRMLTDVGEWDWLCFPFYYLDIDYIERVKRAGWTIQKTDGILCKHHSNASSTIKSDKLRNFINPLYFQVSQQLINVKWNKFDGDWKNIG